MNAPIIILDRDGVINEDSDHYIKSVDEWQPIAGSLEAIGRLHHEGWRIFIATNQSGLARGLFELKTLHAIHQRLRDQLSEMGGAIEAIFFCPHGPDAQCRCRKPGTGLLEDIAHRSGQDLKDVPVIGDSHRDLIAAHTAGAQPILVKTGKGQSTWAAHQSGESEMPANTLVFNDLQAAVDHLLRVKPNSLGAPLEEQTR
jgi:D-glycero-D-manno-heptose 1,7-bisphosphate phosphatase